MNEEPEWVMAARLSGWIPPEVVDKLVSENKEFIREYENDIELCESVIDALVDERVRMREELKELDQYKRDVLENVTERNILALTLGGAREGEKTLQEVAERVMGDLHVLRSERDDAESEVVALKHRIIQLEAGISRLLAKLADYRK